MKDLIVYRVEHDGEELLVSKKDDHHYSILSGDLFTKICDTGKSVEVSRTTLLVPVKPTKIIGIGTNFPDADVEFNKTIPTTFVMPPSALTTSGSEVSIKPYFKSILAEGELGVVIGKTAKNLRKEQVKDVILGYTIVNDLSGRDSALATVSNFVKKSCDGFLPLGPGILLSSSIRHFEIKTTINEKVCQQGHTENLLYSIEECLEFITSFATLEPGDVVSMGTPTPKPSLLPGDTVEVEIDGIGKLVNTIT